jgi:xanthine dehydrogenase accessory factor
MSVARAASPVLSAAPPLGGLRALAAGLRELAHEQAAGVLGVVVATRGSTYRKPGALILLDARGVRVGVLSGGCLEAELEARVQAVLAHGTAALALFDTSGDEDRVFGSGTGCGGSTRVLLLPLPAAQAPLREALLAADERGLALTLALDALGAGTARLDGDDTHAYRFDRHGAPAVAAALPEPAFEVTIRPSRRLLLLGAGPETRPLLQLTRLLGWRVELLERRERWLRYADDGGLDAVHRAGPDALPALLAATRFDAALVMHHNFDLDARGLALLAAAAPPYVGLLGPAARRDELLAGLDPAAREALAPRLHAPVGLPLGGEGAEAIALAIAAQLQARFADDDRRR